MQLTFKASGEKMSSALCKSLKSRYKGDMSELSNKIVSGCGSGGGGKGTTFQFSCNKDDISVSINGKDMGKVHGPGIGAGFCDIYLDDNGVSPSLKDSLKKRWEEENEGQKFD